MFSTKFASGDFDRMIFPYDNVKVLQFSFVCYIYILFQNGRFFSVLLFACKSALVALFKGKYSFDFKLKNKATRADLKENKRTL